MMRRSLFCLSTAATTSGSKLLSQEYANHPDIPNFVWNAALKGGAVPGFDNLRFTGEYSELVQQAYPKEALEVIEKVATKWIQGNLGKSQTDLHERDLENYDEQRRNILAGKPAFAPDTRLLSTVKKNTIQYPNCLTSPDVVTFAPTWKSHFQIHARNVSDNGRCAVGSDSEDAAINTLERSCVANLNDKLSNQRTLISKRSGKSPLSLKDDCGAIFKRIPAMHEISFLNLKDDRTGVWHNLPAWMVEMVLYIHHNIKDEALGGEGGQMMMRPLAFYNPKVISLDHWETYRAVQKDVIAAYGAEGYVFNKPQVENPSMLQDLVALYSDESVIDVNQGFLDYIEQYLRRTGPTMSQYAELSPEEKKRFAEEYPEDRSALGGTSFMKNYYAYFRQVGTKVGKDSEGGMDTRTPSKDPAVFEEQQKMVEEGKQKHAWTLGTRREWAGHPGIAKNCEKPFTQLRVIREFLNKEIIEAGKATQEELAETLATSIDYKKEASQEGTGFIKSGPFFKALERKHGVAFHSLSNEFIYSFNAVLNWKVAKAELAENPKASLKFITSENHGAPITGEELSGYKPSTQPTELNLKQATETFVRYVAAGLSAALEGCISLKGLSSPDLTEERFEDKATAQIGLSSIRRLIQLETPLIPMEKEESSSSSSSLIPCTLELGLKVADETADKIIAEGLPSWCSAQDVLDATLMFKIWMTRDDVRVDLDALTHMFRACEGLPEKEALKAECRQLLNEIYVGKLSAAELAAMGVHQDFGVLSPQAQKISLSA